MEGRGGRTKNGSHKLLPSLSLEPCGLGVELSEVCVGGGQGAGRSREEADMEEGVSRNKQIQGRSRDKQDLRPGLLPPPRTQAPRPEGRYLSEMLWGPVDRGWGSLPEMLLQGMECALRAARPTGNHLWYISLIRRSRLRPCQFMKGQNSGPGRRRDLFKITWLICISSG